MHRRIAALATFIVTLFCAAVASAAVPPPNVDRIWAWEVADTTAGLSMVVSNLPVPADVYFVYATDPQFKSGLKVGQDRAGPSTGGTARHTRLQGLAPRTTYYIMAVAANEHGTTNATGSFTTGGGNAPQITGITHSRVSGFAGVVSLTIVNNNAPCQAYVEYATNPALQGAARTRSQPVQAYAQPIPAHVEVIGLTPQTQYYYRGVCAGGYGAGASAIQSFTTAAQAAPTPPHVDRIWSWNVSDTTAGLSMVVSNLPTPADVYFVYATDPAFKNGIRVGQYRVGPSSGGTAHHQELRGLSPGTTYYAMAVAANERGTTHSTTSFTTGGAIPPQVTSATHSRVSGFGALVSLMIVTNGAPCNASVAYGTDPSLNGASQTHAQPVQAYAQPVPAHVEVLGLQPRTQYYYRGLCAGARGTAAGAIQSFVTGN